MLSERASGGLWIVESRRMLQCLKITILVTVILTSDVVVADIEASFEQVSWQDLYRNIFDVVDTRKDQIKLSEDQLKPAMIHLSVGLANRAENEISQSQYEEVSFWSQKCKIDVTNCNSRYDRRLLRHFERNSLKTLNRRVDYTNRWNLKRLLKIIRAEQYDLCVKSVRNGIDIVKQIESIPRESVRRIDSYWSAGIEEWVIRDIAKHLMKFYNRSARILLHENPSKDRQKFKKLFEQNVGQHCKAITKPLKGANKEVILYLVSTRFDKPLNPTIANWYSRVKHCKALTEGDAPDKILKCLTNFAAGRRNC